MSHPYEHTRFVLHEVPNLKGKCVLDVGCGKGIWGYFLRSEYDENVFMVGLDIWKDYLKHSKRHNVYDDYVLADASRLPFRDKGFDIILACEVIEHMPKSRGWSFLKELERVCRHKIILTTPNGFWPQIISVLNPPDIHKSAWFVTDFKRLGYKVRGIGFRGIHLIKHGAVLWGTFFYIFTPLSYLIPQLGEFLIATKVFNDSSEAHTTSG